MHNLVNMLLLGGYVFLVLPASLLIIASFFVRSKDFEPPSSRRLLLFLILTALVLALLGLLIWFNPYGRKINSSLPAFGVLVVLVPLLAYLLIHARTLAGLWSENKALLIISTIVYLALFAFLWIADQFAFYTAILLALGIALAWYAPRARHIFLGMLSLLTLATLVFSSGGWIFIPGADLPAWFRTALSILTGISLLISILLPAGLLYASLRASPTLEKSRLFWSLVFSLVLLAGAAYQMAWEGIWSAAHARAFEDHLPFIHFLLSLIAGVLLALTLRGWRRLTGPLYVLLVTAVTVVAFVRGWNVSAFQMTERRAALVDGAITAYYDEHSSYPTALADLSPRYLPLLPPPVVVRTGGWCYQSTDSAYRLGYISGVFTYFEQDFKVESYSQLGQLPDDRDCDELLARFQAKELAY